MYKHIHWWATLLITLVLGCNGCDNDATLAYTSNTCNPQTLQLFPKGINQNRYNLPTAACGDPLFEHQVLLPPPSTDSLFLQLENLGGTVTYRVYGLPSGGGAPEELQTCVSTTDIFPNVALYVTPGRYDDLVVSVSREQPSLSDLERNLIRVTAYPYRPAYYKPDGVALNCDGTGTRRILIGTCNPNTFVGAWAREQGLNVVDSLPFPGIAGLAVVELPASIDPNSEPPSIPKKIKQDTINYFVEEDFLIRLTPRSLSPLSTVQSVLDGRQYYRVTDTVAFPAQYIGPATCEALQFRPDVAIPSTSGGDNIVVAVIDSGADTLLSSAIWDRHAYRGSSTPFIQTDGLGYDFINGDFSPDDQLGHGTAVAGAIVSNYRGSRPLTLVHYKIFNGYGEATYFGAITAIYAAVQNGSDIINLSWGIPTEETPLALQCAIDYANDQGVIVVTSAGNETHNVDAEPQWPAAYAAQDTFPNLVTVASYVDENNSISLASFSNYGARSVTLAGYAAAEAPKLGATAAGSTVYSTDVVYGTSISTPLVTRELATILSNLPPGDPTAIDQLLALLEQKLQADQTRNGGMLLPLQCTSVP